MGIIIRPNDPYAPECKFADVRGALARLGKAAAPDARIVDRWCLQPDLARSVADLTAKEGNDKGKLHALVVGVVGFNPMTETTGNSLIEWLVEIRVAVFRWYEFGDNTGKNSQEVVEREARLMSTLVVLNRSDLAMDNPAASSFRGVTRNLEFPRDNIDIVGFAEGVSAHMALGNMQVKVKEELVTNETE